MMTNGDMNHSMLQTTALMAAMLEAADRTAKVRDPETGELPHHSHYAARAFLLYENASALLFPER